MGILTTLVTVVQVICALGVIVLVLLQHGKGADMGAAFGSGASGSLFGATGSANFLSRMTAVLATLFFVCTLALAFLSNNRTSAAPRSVMEQMGKSPANDGIPGAPAQPGAGAVPGSAAPAAPASAAPGSTGAVPVGAAPASDVPGQAPAAAASDATKSGSPNDIPK